jgi:hypothetical protein
MADAAVESRAVPVLPLDVVPTLAALVGLGLLREVVALGVAPDEPEPFEPETWSGLGV